MLKIAWSKVFAHPLPDGHRFPMQKYDLLPEQLLYEGTIREDNLFEPKAISEADILATHDFGYWQKLKELNLSAAEVRRTGFPLSKSLVLRETAIMQGLIECSLFALEHGISMSSAGGTHHAFRDRGEGFCLLNDIAISANYLLRRGLVKKVLVVDLDVHQGDGTASIFENENGVFTFSMHGKNNYPFHKECSNLDIPLLDGIGDHEYLKILQNTLPELIDRQQPDFIFYQAGVDVLATDKLGKFALSINGCMERDKLVLQSAKTNKIPIAVCMGGGYSEKISEIVEAHANTFRLAQYLFF